MINENNPEDFKDTYNKVLSQLKMKFYKRPVYKCECCGRRGKMRYYMNNITICGKSCYKYYYGISEIEFHRDYC